MPDAATRAFDARTTMAEQFPHAYYTHNHLDVLNEWNEESLFESTSTTMIVDETGTVTVTGTLWHSDVMYVDGEFQGYHNRRLDGQFIAVYGDNDELCFLGILTNPGIEVLVDQPIRS
jgi:hypothetical protein